MNRGFSLIELLISLTVGAIALSVGLVNFRNYTLNIRLDQSAEAVAEMVKNVRNRALTTNQEMYVTVATASANLSWQANITGATVTSFRLPYGTVTGFDDADGRINFTARGLADKQYSLTITYTSGRTQNVVVLPTGKVVLP